MRSPATFFAHPVVRRAAWILVAVGFVIGIVGGVYGGLKPKPDWTSFYREPCHVWQHRQIPAGTPMFGYPPTTFFLLWPFTAWAPQPFGMLMFVAVNGLATAGSCWILYRWWYSGNGLRDKGGFVWPLLLSCAHLVHVLQSNQLTVWVLFLCLLGLTLLMHRRDWGGGLALGLAGCVKVLPFLFLFYLALRRRWRAAAGMLLAVVLFDALPSVVFFGLDGAIHEHLMWLRRAEWYSNRRMIEDPYLRIRRHKGNCAVSVVLSRWLRPPPGGEFQVILRGNPPTDVIESTRKNLRENECLVLDPMPRPGNVWTLERDQIPDLPRFRVAHLSAPVVRGIWAGILVVLFGAVFYSTWRRESVSGSEPRWRAEVGLWMLMMFWPTPMMRDYYLALAMPAYVVVWHAVLVRGDTGERSLGWATAIAALVLGFVGVLCLGWTDANFYGLHLATTGWLALACWWAGRAAPSPALQTP